MGILLDTYKGKVKFINCDLNRDKNWLDYKETETNQSPFIILALRDFYYIIQQTGGQFIDLLFNYILYKDYLL